MADEGKKLDDIEINKLKAIVGMEKPGDKESDVERLKELVEKESKEIPAPPVPAEQEKASTEPPGTELKKTEKAEEKTGITKTEKEKADLFVKIEDHKEIASKLLEARKEIKAIAETVELLARAESLKEEAIKRMEEHVQKMEQLWKSVLDRLSEEDRTYPEYFDEEKVIKESEIMDLKAELDKLKHILEKMR